MDGDEDTSPILPLVLFTFLSLVIFTTTTTTTRIHCPRRRDRKSFNVKRSVSRSWNGQGRGEKKTDRKFRPSSDVYSIPRDFKMLSICWESEGKPNIQSIRWLLATATHKGTWLESVSSSFKERRRQPSTFLVQDPPPRRSLFFFMSDSITCLINYIN